MGCGWGGSAAGVVVISYRLAERVVAPRPAETLDVPCSSSAETPCAVIWPPIESVSSGGRRCAGRGRPPAPPRSRRSRRPRPGRRSSVLRPRAPACRTSRRRRAKSPVARTAITSSSAVTATSTRRGRACGPRRFFCNPPRCRKRDVAGLEKIGAIGQLERHGGVLLDEQDRQAAARQARGRSARSRSR